MGPTGSDPRATSVPPTWTTPRSQGPSMLRATGGSSSSTSPRDTATVTTITPRPPGWRPACSLTAPAGCWLPATSLSAPRSTSTTGCSRWTPVTPTEASSSTPTSSPAPAPATSRPKPSLTFSSSSFLSPQYPPSSSSFNQIPENHGLDTYLVLPCSIFLYRIIYLFIIFPTAALSSQKTKSRTELQLTINTSSAWICWSWTIFLCDILEIFCLLPFLWCELL